MNALLRRKKGSEEALAGLALKNFRDTQSAWHDLAYAKELSDYLQANRPTKPKENNNEPVSVRGALLQQAILICVRATEIKQRKGLDIKTRLSAENQLAHAKFLTLRNKAIAHFDPKRPFGDRSFADDAIVLLERPGRGQVILLADRRVYYQFALENDLAELLREALPLGEDRVREALAEIERRLPAVTSKDQKIAKLAFGYRFDALDFYGDPEMANRFLSEGRAVDAPVTDSPIFEGWPAKGDYSRWNEATDDV